MIDIVDRLSFDATRCETTFSKGVSSNIEEGIAEIRRLRAALKPLVETHDYRSLDLGIGTALPDGKMWLEARAIINQQLQQTEKP